MHTISPEIKANDSEANDIFIDTAGHQVKVGQTEIYLTLKEFDMLLFFVKNKGKVISRSELQQKVWGSSQLDTDRTIDIHVCRLRK
ncbi:MAG: winged helix-turn-helix domain-containing protein, partial [Dehalococcoidales bacterium]|nr:winged helix-turn-helix domain-containing protein [Dehalococcoidales bacterium]